MSMLFENFLLTVQSPATPDILQINYYDHYQYRQQPQTWECVTPE